MATTNRARSCLIGSIGKPTTVEARPCSSLEMVSRVRLISHSPAFPRSHPTPPHPILIPAFRPLRLVRGPTRRRPLCQSDRDRRKRQFEETLRQGWDSVHSVPRLSHRQGDRWTDRSGGEDQGRFLGQAGLDHDTRPRLRSCEGSRRVPIVID